MAKGQSKPSIKKKPAKSNVRWAVYVLFLILPLVCLFCLGRSLYDHSNWFACAGWLMASAVSITMAIQITGVILDNKGYLW